MEAPWGFLLLIGVAVGYIWWAHLRGRATILVTYKVENQFMVTSHQGEMSWDHWTWRLYLISETGERFEVNRATFERAEVGQSIQLRQWVDQWRSLRPGLPRWLRTLTSQVRMAVDRLNPSARRGDAANLPDTDTHLPDGREGKDMGADFPWVVIPMIVVSVLSTWFLFFRKRVTITVVAKAEGWADVMRTKGRIFKEYCYTLTDSEGRDYRVSKDAYDHAAIGQVLHLRQHVDQWRLGRAHRDGRSLLRRWQDRLTRFLYP